MALQALGARRVRKVWDATRACGKPPEGTSIAAEPLLLHEGECATPIRYGRATETCTDIRGVEWVVIMQPQALSPLAPR